MSRFIVILAAIVAVLCVIAQTANAQSIIPICAAACAASSSACEAYCPTMCIDSASSDCPTQCQNACLDDTERVVVCNDACSTAGEPPEVSSSSDSDYDSFINDSESDIGIERSSSLENTIAEPFLNPAQGSTLTIPVSTNFSILYNHTVAGGGTTGFWGMVTQLGGAACDNYRSQLTPDVVSCADSQSSLRFYNLSNVNVDGNSMTAQFLYLFETGAEAGNSAVSFCTFRPWEKCTGKVTTIKIVIE